MKKIMVFMIIITFSFLCYFTKQYWDISHTEQNEKKRIRNIEQENNFDDTNTLKSYEKQTSEDDNVVSRDKEKSTENISLSVKDEDCIIYIDEIDFAKIVYTGTERMDHLSQYDLVTATDDMRYSNGGNYIVCGHSSRLYGHSLNRLKEVQPGYHIRIRTDNDEIKYIVDNVIYENMNNTDTYCQQSNNDEITIISCAKYISPNHYIVVHGIKSK